VIKDARLACRRALKAANTYVRPGVPEAMRHSGTYEWLNGKPSAARKWWLKSLRHAKEMGARYDLGMTHLEMGKRLNDREHLKQAEAIFAEIGADFDLAEARRLMQP
jgi:hypothetical protein